MRRIDSPISTQILSARGFTLVEVMVVILIIGLGIGIVSFNIGGNRPLVLRNEAKQLANQFEIVAGEATLGGETWGLQFYRTAAGGDAKGDSAIAWRWLHFREPASLLASLPKNSQEKNNEDKKDETKARLGWQPEAPRDLDGSGQFAANVEAVLEIEGREIPIELLAPEGKKSGAESKAGADEKNGLQPDIWLTPGGETTPFVLRVNFSGEKNGPVIRGDALGRVEVETQDELR